MRTSVLVAVFVALVSTVGAVAAPLRISVPPLLGAVPVVLGSEDGWGLFAQAGLETTLVPLPSQRARMAAFETGQIDVLVTELTQALILVSKRGADAVIAGTTYAPTYTGEGTPPHVALVTQRYAGVTTLEELVTATRSNRSRPLKILVPRPSDLEYMMDQLLAAEGLSVPDGTYVGQDDLLLNATFLSLGSFGAGVFPQPYGEYMLALDAPGRPEFTVLSSFPSVTPPPTVLVVRRSLFEGNPDVMETFFRTLELAADMVNALSRDELLDLGWTLVTKLFLPGQEPEGMPEEHAERVAEAIEDILIPEFPAPGPLDREIFDNVLSWARGKRYVLRSVDYDDVVVPPIQ